MLTVRICWFGIYNTNYSRNYVFLDGLSELGVQVVECQIGPNESFKHFKLAWKYLKLRQSVDVIYVAYPSQSIVPLAKLLTLFSKRVVIMDAFYSMYESIIYDRKLLNKWHPLVIKTAILDWLSVRLADHIVVDTEAHKVYWQTWGAGRDKMTVIPVGSSTRHFYPPVKVVTNEKFLVSFHGTYIPLQGADVVVAAAELLKNNVGIQFRMVGTGQTYDKVREQAKDLANIEFINRVSVVELNELIGQSDVVLGIFGSTEKASRVVPNKVFEGLAVGKPVITLDTKSAREIFSEHDIYFVGRSPERLAEAITVLHDNLSRRNSLSAQGYKTFSTFFSQRAVAKQLLALCKKLKT